MRRTNQATRISKIPLERAELLLEEALEAEAAVVALRETWFESLGRTVGQIAF